MPTPRPRRRDLLIAGTALLTGCSVRTQPTAAPQHATSRPQSAPPTAVASTRASAGASPGTSGGASGGADLTHAVRNSEGDVAHGLRTTDTVALTFHGAGAAAVTRRVLAELSSAKAVATVFAVGSWLDAEPSLARAVLDSGHELGNHTYHHLPMRTLSTAQAQVEVARAAAVLTRLVGNRGAWFRPSGTQRSTATIRMAAARSGYPVCISYDVDSLDWTDPGPQAVVSTVLAQTLPGSIVSLHLGHAGTATALPAVLDGLARRGLRPVTVSELLA